MGQDMANWVIGYFLPSCLSVSYGIGRKFELLSDDQLATNQLLEIKTF